MDALPPTEAALLQHVKRVAYQAGHVWSQALLKDPVLLSSLEWGWIKTNMFNYMGAILNSTAIGIKILPRTDYVWL